MTEIRSGCIANALYTGKVDIIAHVVNCSGAFRSGVAQGVRKQFPSVFTAYERYLMQIGAERSLGQAQYVNPRELLDTPNPQGLVFNLYAQADWDRNWQHRNTPDYTPSRQLNLGALSSCLDSMVKCIKLSPTYDPNNPPVVAFPWEYGCVRAGGHWESVKELTEWAFRRVPLVYYQYNPRG